MSDQFVGPCKLPCPERCDVPEGVTLTKLDVLPDDVRHAWSDVLRCPNGCDRVFLVAPRDLTSTGPVRIMHA